MTNKEKKGDRSDYYKYHKMVLDIGGKWHWERCEWEEYKRLRQENKYCVTKSRK